jgi:hypothetical protein
MNSHRFDSQRAEGRALAGHPRNGRAVDAVARQNADLNKG